MLDAARVGARVNVEGVRSVVTEMNNWLGVLKKIRSEIDGINSAAGAYPGMGGGGGGGSAPTGDTTTGTSSAPLSKFRSMQNGWGGGNRALGAFGLVATTAAIGKLTGMASDRFNRNLNESIPISQNDMFLTSQYGAYRYGYIDRDRLTALGKFGMSRQESAGALNIGLGYGQSSMQGMNFLRNTVAPVVQASGGTLTPTQAAGMAGAFQDPLVMRRAVGLGITPGRLGGQVQNPLTVAQGYITDFEKRLGVRLNAIDFENLRSPGSRTRFQMKQIYGLSDEAIETVIQAGMQNNTFRGSHGGRNINFSSGSDLSSIGLQGNRLGLKAFEYMSASAGREAKFFQQQEGAQVGKLGVDITIENTLAKLETSFSSLLGPIGEFQRVIGLATGALQLMAGLNFASSMLGGGGGGGGLGGLLRGTLGGGGGAAGGAGGGLGMMARLGGVAVGVGGVIAASNYGASHGGVMGGVVGIGGSAAGGALAGFSVAGAPGAVVGAIAGGAYGAAKFWGGMNKRDVAKAARGALSLSDAQLVERIRGEHSNPLKGSYGGSSGEQGEFDVWQMRRGALLAATLNDMIEQGVFKDLKPTEAERIKSMIDFFGTDKVKSDWMFGLMGAQANDILPRYQTAGAGREIWKKYFGSAKTAFDMAPIDTDEARGLAVSETDQTAAILGSGSNQTTGDPVSGKGASGSTWDRLDPQFRGPLTNLLQAAGGKVWLGNGWRSEEQQRALFLDRHVVDPNGDISWNGQKWKLKKGAAPAAPPGRSMHELGRAADLEGDLSWVQSNAAKFGLKTFAGVNGEPWHVQLASDPNSRSDYDNSGTPSSQGSGGGGGTSSSSMMLGASLSTNSGVNFSLASSRPTGGGGGEGSMYMSTSSSSTSGSLGGAATGAGKYSAQQVAAFAYNAGFRGSDLVNFVAIAMRESGGNSFATNETGPDLSYGLFQINLKPWADKGTAAPYTKDQLYDPQFNANVAFQYFQQRGMSPWSIKGNSLARTDIGAAQAAVSAGGYGDGPFASGGGGGGFNYAPTINVSVSLAATGNLQYDADMLANAAAEKANEKLMMAARRSS